MKYRKYNLWLGTFVLLLSLLLLNCGKSPYTRRQSPSRRYAEMEAELLFDEAYFSYSDRNFKIAIQGFEKLVKNYPNSWKRSEAMYLLAESYSQSGQSDKTIQWAKRQIDEYSESQFTDDSYFLLGHTYLDQYKYTKAVESYLKAADFTEDNGIVEQSENKLRDIVNKVSVNELIQMGEAYKFSKMIPLVYIAAAHKYMDEGKNEQAKEILEYTITSYPINSYTQEAEYLYDLKWNKDESDDFQVLSDTDYIQNQDIVNVDSSKIGLIAPFTGKYTIYGRSVKNGVQLALDEYNVHAQKRMTLISYDSKGEPVESVKAARKLIDNEGVIAIIGPIMSGPTISAATLSDLRKTILITPTATEQGISSIGEYIFQLNSSSQSTLFQAEDMAIYAFEKMGFRRFATLYPNERYAMNLAETFARKVKQLGGEIVAEEQYLAGNTDFQPQMEFLEDAAPEAIYIPAHADDILMIAPQLKFNNISAQILGSDSWNSEKIIRLGDYYVEGAVFTAIFYDKGSFSEANSFHTKYRYKNNSDPDITSALGYDSMKILLNGISKGGVTREALMNQISTVEDYLGASGEITFLRDGRAKRKTFLLTISEGKIIEVEE